MLESSGKPELKVVGVRILAEAKSEEVARKPEKNIEVMKKKG